MTPVVAPPNKLLSRCKPLMIVSLLTAVACLTAYAVIATLGS